MKIRPIYDRILVKPKDAEAMTKGGIYIAETTRKKPQEGTVVSVGDGHLSAATNDLRPCIVKAGDRIIFDKYSGVELPIDDIEYVMLREENVLGILET